MKSKLLRKTRKGVNLVIDTSDNSYSIRVKNEINKLKTNRQKLIYDYDVALNMYCSFIIERSQAKVGLITHLKHEKKRRPNINKYKMIK